MSEAFSAPYASCSVMSFMASIQCVVIGAGVERRLSGWSLGWDIRLFSVAYAVSFSNSILLSTSGYVELQCPNVNQYCTLSDLQLICANIYILNISLTELHKVATVFIDHHKN